MTNRELIKQLANEYFTEYHNSELLDKAPDFYDYLIRHGFNRFQLSALGIGRDIQAGNAQQWRGDQLL